MTGAKGRTGAGAFAKKNCKWLVPLVVVAAAGAVFLIGGGRNGAASRDVTDAETTPVRQGLQLAERHWYAERRQQLHRQVDWSTAMS